VGLACAILPCELHYDFVGLPAPAPAATPADREPAAGAAGLPSGDREGEPRLDLCCPS
jgi:hypothetical protein